MDEFWKDLDLSSPGKIVKAILISVIAGLVLKGIGKAYPPVSRWLFDNANRMLAVIIAASIPIQLYSAIFGLDSMTLGVFMPAGWWVSEVLAPICFIGCTTMIGLMLVLYGARLANLAAVFLIVCCAGTVVFLACTILVPYPLRIVIEAGIYLYIMAYWSIVVSMAFASIITIVENLDETHNRIASA